MGKQETLETIWEVPDELWERIEPIILEEDPPNGVDWEWQAADGAMGKARFGGT